MGLLFEREKIKKFAFEEINNTHPILKALKNEKLIMFVGAGMSVHLGIPSWRNFALNLVDKIYDYRITTFMNYKTKESLKKEDTKKILSICKFICNNCLTDIQFREALEDWFKVKEPGKVLNKSLYNKLFKLNAIYVTTNYDDALDIVANYNFDIQLSLNNKISQVKIEDNKRVFYDINEFDKKILKPKNVIHIHGSIQDIASMVISYEDYIQKYGTSIKTQANEIRVKYINFLSNIFEDDNVVLFIGYGLEEIEILQFLFEGELGKRLKFKNSRYLLLPCYSDDYLKISYLAEYYLNLFNVNIIPYDISEKGFEALEDVIDLLNELNLTDYKEIVEIDELKQGLKYIEEM